VITYLNTVTGRRFDPFAKTNIAHAQRLLKAGYKMAQVERVIDAKWEEWGRSKKMAKRMHPDTLFRLSNFRRYLENDVDTGEPVIVGDTPRKIERVG
jgi:uncharacterized phage protein (TIGR02220 family)